MHPDQNPAPSPPLPDGGGNPVVSGHEAPEVWRERVVDALADVVMGTLAGELDKRAAELAAPSSPPPGGEREARLDGLCVSFCGRAREIATALAGSNVRPTVAAQMLTDLLDDVHAARRTIASSSPPAGGEGGAPEFDFDTTCRHEKVRRPSRPIADWSSREPCPDCGQRINNYRDASGRNLTVAESNARVAERSRAAQDAAAAVLERQHRGPAPAPAGGEGQGERAPSARNLVVYDTEQVPVWQQGTGYLGLAERVALAEAILAGVDRVQEVRQELAAGPSGGEGRA